MKSSPHLITTLSTDEIEDFLNNWHLKHFSCIHHALFSLQAGSLCYLQEVTSVSERENRVLRWLHTSV